MTTAHMGNPTTYSYTPDGLSGIVRYDSRTSAYTPYAVETDHLGSITALYNSSGTKVLAASYDAWGKRTVTTGTLEFRRGFTGHEHIDGYDLINMNSAIEREHGEFYSPVPSVSRMGEANGRVYDPLIGRFLSPDPFVQMPDFSQNFNRYSYCLNNPYKYTDPSGEFFTALAGMFCPALLPIGISIDIGWMSGAHKSYYYQDVSMFEGACRGALSGAVSGALSMVGGGTLVENMLCGMFEGATSSSLDAALWGEKNKSGVYLRGMAYGALFTLLTSQNIRNFIKGKGFFNNERVFANFREGKYIIPDGVDWQQYCLEYFGFEGKYNPDIRSKNYKSDSYLGTTDPKIAEIYYGDLAFENYSTLYGTYTKESYHLQKIKNNISLYELPDDLQGIGIDYYLEEIYGYIYAYKRQGLFMGNKIHFSGVEYYQSQLDILDVSYPTYPSRYSWIYKLPRRW